MITKLRYNQLDEPQFFSVSETINLPLLTEDKAHAGREKEFQKDGKFFGFPADVQLFRDEDGNMVPYGEMKGFLIEDEGGQFLIPAELILVPENGQEFGQTPIETAVGDITGEGKEVLEDAKQTLEQIRKEADRFNPERTLGFSYKQLLVIGVVGLLVIKLSK